MDSSPNREFRRRQSAESPSGPDAGANGSGEPLHGSENGPLDTTSTKFPVIPGGATAGNQGPGSTEMAQEPLWWRRTKLVIFVGFCVELGMIMAVLPWTQLWTDNNLLLAYPGLHALVRQNFVRGIISGIGLIDIWMGIWEAAKYKETKQ
jgi:hypothetical protein